MNALRGRLSESRVRENFMHGLMRGSRKQDGYPLLRLLSTLQLKKIIFILLILILTSKICPGSIYECKLHMIGECELHMEEKDYHTALNCFQEKMDFTKDKSIYYFLILCSREVERKNAARAKMAKMSARRKARGTSTGKSSRKISRKGRKVKQYGVRKKSQRKIPIVNLTKSSEQYFKEFAEIMKKNKEFKGYKKKFYYNYRFYLTLIEYSKYEDGEEFLKISKEVLEKHLTRKMHKIEIANYYLTAGYHYFYFEDYNEAIKMYTKSKEYNPSWQSSYYFLAKAYLFNEDYENAEKYAKKAVKLIRSVKIIPLTTQSLLIEAEIPYKMKKYKIALRKLEKIIKKYSNYIDAYILRTRIYIKSKDIKKAEKEMQKIEKVPKDRRAEVSLLKADILFEKKEYDEALELYENSLTNKNAKLLKLKGYDIKRRKARIDYIERHAKSE